MEIQIKDGKIYAPLKDKWLTLTPEEEVRQDFICDLVNIHGYAIEQLEQDLTNSYTDIVIWKTSTEKTKRSEPSIIVVVELKAEYLNINTKNFKNGYQFANIKNAKLFIAKNKKETNIYYIGDKDRKKVKKLNSFPNSSILLNDTKFKKYINDNVEFNKEDFSKLLSKCHNIIRNNDKLSPEAAFDEISKVLFIKIRFEKDSRRERLIFSKENLLKKAKDFESLYSDLPLYQALFNQTKDFYKEDSLFEDNEILRIRESSFFQLVEELEKYNLSSIADDVKGIAFEQFLGRTFRGELGQFFTPRPIVEFMTNILDPKEGEFLCDPCCGSGGFLINAFEYVWESIANDIQKEKEILKKKYKDAELVNLCNKLDSEMDNNTKDGRIYNLSRKFIFGTDANPRMARTAKMNMIMHGDGHGGVHHNEGLLNINGVFENRFDVILTNPPFGARVEKDVRVTKDDIPSQARIDKFAEEYQNEYIKQVIEPLKEWASQDNGKNKPKGKPILDLYQTGKMSTLTEVLFIERSLNLLKPGGRMGIVLPEGVLNNTNLQKIRDFVESKAKIILITSIPQDVFIASGATVKPSLLFFKKFTDDEAKLWDKIAAKAEKDINKKYAAQLNPINEKLALRGKDAPSASEKKALRKQLKELQEKIDSEIKSQIKQDFDYEIPIAEVEKAGISTTGAEIENELIPLCEEYTKYRKQKHLWENKYNSISYQVLEDGKMFRIPSVGEPDEIYANEQK